MAGVGFLGSNEKFSLKSEFTSLLLGKIILLLFFVIAQTQKFIRDHLNWFAKPFHVNYQATKYGVISSRMIGQFLEHHIR